MSTWSWPLYNHTSLKPYWKRIDFTDAIRALPVLTNSTKHLEALTGKFPRFHFHNFQQKYATGLYKYLVYDTMTHIGA